VPSTALTLVAQAEPVKQATMMHPLLPPHLTNLLHLHSLRNGATSSHISLPTLVKDTNLPQSTPMWRHLEAMVGVKDSTLVARAQSPVTRFLQRTNKVTRTMGQVPVDMNSHQRSISPLLAGIRTIKTLLLGVVAGSGAEGVQTRHGKSYTYNAWGYGYGWLLLLMYVRSQLMSNV
jgi:hypothetical protein